MPFSTVGSVESCWYFGQRYCQLHSCFEGSFCYASIYHLCFISLDRYIAVTDPLVYPTRFTVCFCHVYCHLLALFYYLHFFPSWHRSECSWTGGSSKCSHLCGRLSNCSESELGIGEFSIIFHPHPCDDSSLLQDFPHC